MKKIVLAAMCLLFTNAISIAGPSGSSSGGSAEWSNPVNVIMVGSNLSKSPTHGYFNRFGVSGGACPAGSAYTELRVSNSEYALEAMNGMKAVLLSAQASGLPVRVRWEGPYCWVSDVMICESAANCPMY